MGSLPIKFLTDKNFSKYGRILLPNEEDRKINPKGRFFILEKSKSLGWRVACLEETVRERTFISNHPDTKETFEPLEGSSILVVAPPDNPDSTEAFILDKPIVLNEGVWHSEPIALSEKVMIRITENLNVKSTFYLLPYKIKAELCIEKYTPSKDIQHLIDLGYTRINGNIFAKKETE